MARGNQRDKAREKTLKEASSVVCIGLDSTVCDLDANGTRGL
jgi:hypothetical protein